MNYKDKNLDTLIKHLDSYHKDLILISKIDKYFSKLMKGGSEKSKLVPLVYYLN